MRKLILTRGAPGSGKSSLLRDAGLLAYSLSMDDLRLIRMAPHMTPSGHLAISQENNLEVLEEFRKLTGGRLMRGELLCVDTTLSDADDLRMWVERAGRFGYEVAVLDFSKLSMETLLERNAQREEHRRVSSATIERMKSQIDSHPIGQDVLDSVLWIDASQDREVVLGELRSFLDVPVRDFSHYKKVVHIGDLQGCLTALVGPGGILENGFEDDVAYVFVGDLVDRGIENGKVMRWLIDNTQGRDNVFFMWGNHEDHLRRYSQGEKPVSGEFRDRTQPQLEAAGVTPAEVGRFLSGFLDVLPYSWHGQKVMVSHAGLASVPQDFVKISQWQYARGTGNYDDPVDDQFARQAPEGWVQVHGHRNPDMKATQASRNSFNLEDSVEFGGNLRSVILDENGWTTHANKNTVFAPLRERPVKAIPGSQKRGDPMPLGQVPAPWVAQESQIRLSEETMRAMEQHPGVRTRTSERNPNVISLNFTKDVFFDASWDAVTAKARGLFVDKNTLEVVARGYDKFFNVGEREETKLSNLLANMKFPVSAYVKENGFLGLVGFDAKSNDLFLSSKASPDGEFSDHFRRIFNAQVPEGRREALRRWLRDNEACAVFEVIDPKNDPHMIDYPDDQLVVLDIFHRSESGKKLDYAHLKAVCNRFGLTAKRRAMEFRGPEQMQGWYKAIEGRLDWRWKGEDIEGMVLEDAEGALTKVKLPHYAFWKRMRSAKDRLARLMGQREKAAAPDPYAERRQEILDQLARAKAATVGAPPEDLPVLQERLRSLGTELGSLPRPEGAKKAPAGLEDKINATVHRDPHPLAIEFMRWALTKEPEHLDKSSIIELRKQFIDEVKPAPALYAEPWVAFAEAAAEDDGSSDEPLDRPTGKKPKP